MEHPKKKAEYVDKILQDGMQNAWVEHLKKEDKIGGWNISRRKREYLDSTSQERRQNTWIECPKKEDGIPGENKPRRN